MNPCEVFDMNKQELKCPRCNESLAKSSLNTILKDQPVYICNNSDCIGWFWCDAYEVYDS